MGGLAFSPGWLDGEAVACLVLSAPAEAAALRAVRGASVGAWAAGEPPEMYAWDVESGEAGVTDDRDAAVANVDRVLRGAVPGARIRMVTVSTYGRSEYIELGVVGEARREGGGVVWTSR